ncbi:lymphocyte antigen 6E-like [Hyla sarda]|uniref:lymphocyte antigen 6E-like n=1 Tax=Hyla sarda TaxID=327740 RepID=UPI0024C27C18|nr:lymphocyte antigen 6E-like [Hyla sarda]
MAAYTSLLLITALCVGTVHSLTCYTCTSQSSNTNCMTATNCSASETSCMTSVVSRRIGSLTNTTITKSCSSDCVAMGFNLSIFSVRVTCCRTNLCNTSGSSSIKSISTILAAAREDN